MITRLFRFDQPMETTAMLLRKIEVFLGRTGLAPTTFGRLAVSDPRLVFDLRNGREPRVPMQSRVEHFMNTFGETGNA